MGDTVDVEPAAIDRAIARLTTLLDLMDEQEPRVGELQHVVRPGDAPSTQAFHGLLGRSMAKLRLQHDVFRRNVQNQIAELRKSRQTYVATDQAVAGTFRGGRA